MKHVIERLMYHCTALAALLILGVGTCHAQAAPQNASPALTGSASAPVSTKPNTYIAYTITLTDGDTWVDMTTGQTFVLMDTTCSVIPVRLTGLATWAVATRGTNPPTYTYTFDISGKSVPNIGNYIDTWELKDGKAANDKLHDPSIQVQQTVVINL